MDLRLTGKTTIITGGSGGIGRGLVLGFAEEGCNVVIAPRDTKKGQEVAAAAADLPGETIVVQTDVTNRENVASTVAQTLERYGQIDVLVNNAGGVAHPHPTLEKPDDQWDWELNLNIWGVVHCTRSVGAHMVERGSGSIVNITSNSALLGEAAQQVPTRAKPFRPSTHNRSSESADPKTSPTWPSSSPRSVPRISPASW